MWLLFWLFGVVSVLCWLLFCIGVLCLVWLLMLVVVIGNVMVGGVGKMFVVIVLVLVLVEVGLWLGIVLCGYGV